MGVLDGAAINCAVLPRRAVSVCWRLRQLGSRTHTCAGRRVLTLCELTPRLNPKGLTTRKWLPTNAESENWTVEFIA
jgi:hypothetical protein